MLLTAEVRWYWPRHAPGAVVRWFESGHHPPGGSGSREDVYLCDRSTRELGVKKRGGRTGVEIKGLVAKLPPEPEGPLPTGAEIWCKWSTQALDLEARDSVTLRKQRHLRKFDLGGTDVREIALDAEERPLDPQERLPDEGCNLELTRVTIVGSGEKWESLGFEAFGSLANLAENLRRTAMHLQPPVGELRSAQVASYPAWLHGISRCSS